MSLSLNLHPVGVEPTELRYHEFVEQLGLDPDANSTKKLPCSDSNATWLEAFFDQVLDGTPNSGVDTWWTDGTCDGGTYGGSWENQYAYSERIREHRELRGYVMSRWGGVGSQRSPLGFSGDQTTAWPTLQFQVESTPTASNVLFNSWSHDIGGFDCCGGPQGGDAALHYGNCPFPAWPKCETNSSTDSGSQLLVRWLQHGALSAVDRVHCGGCNREFWNFPNFAAMQSAMHLRNELFPYIYTENHLTRDTGISLVHPVYYDAPQLDRSYEVPSEYFFGSAMLVQPIVQPIPAGEAKLTQSTWLPPGEWSDWLGQKAYAAGESGLDVSAEYSVDELPMFVRTGSVVPMRTNASLLQTVAFSDPLVWVVWPGSSSSSSSGSGSVSIGNATVYEDDGSTLRFEDGALAATTMSWSRGHSAGGGLSITVQPTVGSFDVGCSAEDGFEYAGPGADLQDIGAVPSADKCCDACAGYSNCAFWTWNKGAGNRCVLKVSRRGRRANSSAVSGVAPRRMASTRSHRFQLRSPDFAAHPPVSVELNGAALPKVAQGSGEVGWYVQTEEEAGTSSFATATGALMIHSASIKLSEQVSIEVRSK
jgi:hypothetical protein